ncbi:hypothetical protein QUF73_03780 [Cytobacillus sp. NJ13]|nr:hypothetical protein [Cytobacillus sp. NJ13]
MKLSRELDKLIVESQLMKSIKKYEPKETICK